MDRRRFLRNAAASLGGAAIAASGGKDGRKAFAATRNRRHLINVQAGGGWDSYWFYQAMRPSDAQFADSKLHHNDVDSNGNVIRTYDDVFTRRFDDKNGRTPYLVHPNYKNALGAGQTGKGQNEVLLGLGAKLIYGNNPSELNDLLIWRGMSYDNGHGIGNKVLLHGSLSAYALSYCSLAALELEKDYLRPLHFAQLASTPADLNTNWAMAKGSALPVNIANYSSFDQLTKPSPSEFADVTRRNSINASISRLSQMVSGFQLKGSANLYQSFLTSFNGGVTVGSSNLAQSSEFKSVWKSYVMEMIGVYDTMMTGPDFVGANSLIMSEWIKIGSTSIGSDVATAKSRLNPSLTVLDDFLAVRNTAGLRFYNQLVDVAFNYAMAFFLVKNDLSAVVDIPTPCGDYHDLNDEQSIELIMTYGLFRKLVADLKSTEAVGTGGRSLLDITCVIMNSEFDREPNLSINTNTDRRGTGHGNSSSVLMAGYGVATGRVIGAVKKGPGSSHVKLTGEDLYPKQGFSAPLPVDSDGNPDPGSSTVINTKSVFPTVCQIFGITVPANQVTDASYVSAVLKKS
jgi:hypothetical protein